MFIGGLNSSTTNDVLRAYFSQFGEVASTTVMTDQHNGRSAMLFYWCPLSGCLQLLEILEISWNLKTLLEILEISWNLIGHPGNFCVRCRRSTALVCSHKNMDKYSLQKYKIYRHQMCFFNFQMHQNPFSAGALPRTPVGELMTLPHIPIWLGRAEIPIFSSPEEAEARQTCPGFFLKSLLESSGNLLD